MKKEEFEKITQKMKEKLGEENIGIIADDLASLIADNANMNNILEEKENSIKNLEEQNKNILITNGNLLQQVSMSVKDTEEKEEPNEEIKKFNIKNAFDEKRKFYRMKGRIKNGKYKGRIKIIIKQFT